MNPHTFVIAFPYIFGSNLNIEVSRGNHHRRHACVSLCVYKQTNVIDLFSRRGQGKEGGKKGEVLTGKSDADNSYTHGNKFFFFLC